MEKHLIQELYLYFVPTSPVCLFFVPFCVSGGIKCFSFHMGISVQTYLVCQFLLNLTGEGEKLKIVANR